MLHLLGMDHEDDDEAEAMEAASASCWRSSTGLRLDRAPPSPDSSVSTTRRRPDRRSRQLVLSSVVVGVPRPGRDGADPHEPGQGPGPAGGAPAWRRHARSRSIEHPERWLNPVLLLDLLCNLARPPWSAGRRHASSAPSGRGGRAPPSRSWSSSCCRRGGAQDVGGAARGRAALLRPRSSPPSSRSRRSAG